MYLMIDNYDSFVYNLVTYFRELGSEITVKRNDEISLDYVTRLKPQAIIISPGPKRPTEAGISEAIVQTFKDKTPILGVCLGHQVIAHAFGAVTRKGEKPVHGKVTPINHNGTGLFQGLPHRYQVTRYHSLTVEAGTLPAEIGIDAYDDNNTVMAISHKKYPLYGVQFHPEALLTEYGHELLANFRRITEEWR